MIGHIEVSTASMTYTVQTITVNINPFQFITIIRMKVRNERISTVQCREKIIYLTSPPPLPLLPPLCVCCPRPVVFFFWEINRSRKKNVEVYIQCREVKEIMHFLLLALIYPD
jgi:hypothetical protein